MRVGKKLCICNPESGCNPVKLKGTSDPMIILVSDCDWVREHIAPVHRQENNNTGRSSGNQ